MAHVINTRRYSADSLSKRPNIQASSPKTKALGIWNLEFGIWNLRFGIWNLRHTSFYSILCLLLFLIIPVIAFSQNTNIPHTQPTPPDTSEYQIIYEVDTIHQTKTIIEHDTIVQTDTSARKPDTAKSVIHAHDSIHSKLDTTSLKTERHFFVDFLVSPFTYTDIFKGNDASANTLIDYMKANEKPQPSFTISLLPEYKFNRWSIQSGAQFSLLKNNYSYPYQTEKQSTYYKDTTKIETIPYIIDVYYQVTNTDTTMDTIWGHHKITVYDSLKKTLTTKQNQIEKGIQYCGFIEVPVVFGYEFLHYKRFSLELKTGVITSFLVYRKGEIVTSDNGTQTFINLSNYPFVSTSLSGYLGLNIAFRVSKNTRIEIIPYFQEGYTSLLQKKSSISQSIDRKGISIGFKF